MRSLEQWLERNIIFMKIVKVEEQRIIFDNGSVLESYHEQDCCEDHYVDFTSINDQGFENENFPEQLRDIIATEADPLEVNEWGEFNIDSFFDIKDKQGNKYTLTIYNSNNGYYSTDVNLILTHKNGDVETFRIQ